MPNITFGRWNPTEVLERRLDNDWPSPTPYATNLVTPTSLSSTGTGNSSSIGANGSVTFSSCATLSLNGVFTSDYDNYMVVFQGIASTTHTPDFRLRASGTDASGSNYTYQYLYGNDISVTAGRATTTVTYPASISTTRENGMTMYLYGPNLAQPTAGRSVTVAQSSGAQIWDLAWTHSLSTAYDGFSFNGGSTYTLTGLISVYGLGV